MSGLKTATTLALVAMMAGGVVALAHATTSGRNGKIVYQSSPPHRLWIVNADGTGLRKLTTTKGSQRSDENPDWSPNGSKVTFEHCERHCQVWTINADGKGLKRVGSCNECGQPSWSPNGKLIAFSHGWGGIQDDQIKFAEIFVMNAGGGGVRQVTHVTTDEPSTADVGRPAWSPDGKQLVFEVHNSRTGDPAKGRTLFVVDADGSNLRQLTPWQLNGGGKADWSPSGRLILFRSISPAHEEHGNLYTIHPDGSGLKKLTNYPEPKTVGTGSFSPDGKWITFNRFAPGGPYPSIFVMRANGTGVRQLVQGKIGFVPDWGSAR
jgi:TolB protein